MVEHAAEVTMQSISHIWRASLWCLLLCVGCTPTKVDAPQEVDLSAAEYVSADTFHVDQCVLNTFWLRASGETLVMLNHKRDPIFDAFAIPEVEYVSSGISKGEGPEEVANVMPLSLERSTRPGQFTFLTGVPSEIVTIRTPDFKIIDKSRHRMPEGWPGEQNMLIIKGDTVLAQRFSEPLDWIIAEGEGNIVSILDITIPDDIKIMAGDDVWANMVIHSAIGLASPDGSRVAVCPKMYPMVFIFDDKGNKIRTLTMPYTAQMKNYILSADCNSDAIYICYHDPADTDYTSSIVVAIDRDGNVGKIYKVPGPAAPMTVDDTGRYIFYTGSADDNTIYRIKL